MVKPISTRVHGVLDYLAALRIGMQARVPLG